MPIHVALNHVTTYKYDRPVTVHPHTIRLRPAPHCRTPILGYSLNITPKDHFINWQQDAYGNYLARIVFKEPVVELKIEVDLVAQMTIINPFDFFIEEYAEKYPFTYEKNIAKELAPYFETLPLDSRLGSFVSHIRSSIARPGRRTIDVLVDINQLVQRTLKYDIRLEPGVQTPEETLTKCHGSCRDFTWLMVQTLRHLGYAARFVSGYSIQLVADVKALDGPSGVAKDITDLHAWTEVFIPGAGWVGFDSTSGLMCGEGHIPLAATADPGNAAPISGGFSWPYEEGKSDFDFQMSVTRVHEDPRVTKPYTPEQWNEIQKTGQLVDISLTENDVRLTMGGEPTFVSVDDMEGAEWNTAALGNHKRKLAGDLIKRLRRRFGKGALLHYGQGKWYPGESLPRWALSCIWRKDGVPIWEDESLIADEGKRYNFGESEARAFIHELAENLGVTREHIQPGHEDVWYYLWKERRLPVNVDPFDNKLENVEDRKRLAKVFEQGLSSIVGYALPISPVGGGEWKTGPWFLRSERMYLLPGDSPMGFRLPLDSLPWVSKAEFPYIYEHDPLEKLEALEDPRKRQQFALRGAPGAVARASVLDPRSTSKARGLHATGMGAQQLPGEEEINDDLLKSQRPSPQQSAPWLVRTALCVEPRNGALHVFMPPVRNTMDYLDLVAQIEHTASTLKIPVVIEGYPVPHDSRLSHLKVTPDP
ncbi:MAG TPA: transglutaminase family protein, partial [Phycisphaerae bacterium]|nr:transglutaminase family protein [Phycisphaerae bacterium]